MTSRTRFLSSALATGALLCLLSLHLPPPEQAPAPTKQAMLGNATPTSTNAASGESERASERRQDPLRSAPRALPLPELPHPHPITAQHERIFRENNLTFALDGAVDVEDVSGIRRLLAIYRQEYPEDSLVLQQGYEIIAECLEHPGIATRTVAQHFYDTELASALRRHVRRHCLEKS